ncbi:27 kDa hemolymph protein-like isoform X2 [Leptopilina heterotoma]|uniref:27 kDa hemolymph protein-like isoform X2 n=1 Tax=Leptopilina heterotoma TaxID=63436 RepID=UPI001CA94261|nr:27 kDa hemolymph protein-like isoform X2 [Leptopilina heterotoma]
MKFTILFIVSIGFFSQCFAQDNIENADDALNKLNSIVDIPELKNINASALPVQEFENVIKKKCEKNGGPTAYETAKKGILDLGACVTSLVNVTQLNKEIEDAKPTGDLDEVFAKYCRKSTILKHCVRNWTEALKPCLEPPEQALEPIVLNITNSLLDFICFKEGDRIALFISTDGPKCFQDKQLVIQQCLNSTYGESVQNISTNVNNISEMTLPLFVLDHKSCSDLVKLQVCVVKELETCDDQTPANIAEALFNFVIRVTPCEKLLGL